MIRPSSRLMIATTVIAVPLCIVAGLYPQTVLLCVAGLFACAAAAAVDAVRGVRTLAGWGVSTPAQLRWFQGRETDLTLVLSHHASAAQTLRIHIQFPPQITVTEKVTTTRIEGTGLVQTICIPRERGEFTIHICDLESQSPLNLWNISRAANIDSAIRVYPDLRATRSADLLRGHQLAGAHLRRQLGKGREFDKLRDYAPGDNFEDIDWKATARRRHPVVKVFQIERTQEIFVVIDSSRLSTGGALDSYVTAALTLAITAESQHDRFGLASFSAGIDRFLPAAGGKRHFAFCRDAIYALQPRPVTPDVEDIFSYLHTHLRRRSLLIFLTALDDPFLSEAFVRNIRILSRRHIVMVNVPERSDIQPLFSGETPETSDQIYSKLAGHMHWAKLRELQKTLDRQGVRLAVVRPDRLPQQLSRQYLEIKQRQLL